MIATFSNLASAQQLADLGQQQHVHSTTAFTQWFINSWDATTSEADLVVVLSEASESVNAAVAGALRLLAAVAPSALLQQVRPDVRAAIASAVAVYLLCCCLELLTKP
jgi:uncharacterized NAD(P)/FAD-binding protein YdhS